MEEEKKKSRGGAKRVKKKKRSIVPLIIILLLLLLAAVAIWLMNQEPAEEPDTTPTFAANASVGPLPGKTEEEIKAMLDQKITDAMVAYTVNANPVFETGTAEGNLMLESPGNNINYIEFVIDLDETGETVYRSGLLQPNQYIENDKLLVDLEPGRYPCTVTITLYDPETLQAKGLTQAGINIKIKN